MQQWKLWINLLVKFHLQQIQFKCSKIFIQWQTVVSRDEWETYFGSAVLMWTTTANIDTFFSCLPWLNHTTLIIGYFIRRCGMWEAFHSSCSRQWVGSLSYHIHTCYYTECPPKIRLYSLFILHRKPCSHFQWTGEGKGNIHSTAPDISPPICPLLIYQPAHLLFHHYQIQKATLRAIQFESTRKIKQPIHCQVSSHTIPVGFSCCSAFSFQKVSSSLLSSVRTLRVQRTQQHFQIILFNKKC